MAEPLGYIVIEWNQAGGPPDIASQGAFLMSTQEEAEHWAETLQRQAAPRRDRFTVAEVTELEEDQ